MGLIVGRRRAPSTSQFSCSGCAIHMHQRRLTSSSVLALPSVFSRAVRILVGLCLFTALSGCIVTGYEKPDLALEIPDKYKAGHGDKAPPELDWWRGFRSRELTAYVEHAQTAN